MGAQVAEELAHLGHATGGFLAADAAAPVAGTEVFAVGRDVVASLTRPERVLAPLPEGLTALTYVG